MGLASAESLKSGWYLDRALVSSDHLDNFSCLELCRTFVRKEQAKLKRDQVSVETASASVIKQDTPVSSQTKCKHCRGESHGADTMHTRKAKCPAWDQSVPNARSEATMNKCTDCGKWGHKSKQSRWCEEGEDKQDSEPELGSMMSAITMWHQRKGYKKKPAPKQACVES